MSRSIAIIGCLDTKGEELKYLQQCVEKHGLKVVMIDTGVLGSAPFPCAVGRADVARAAGTTIEELQRKNDRGWAVAAMCRGAAAVVERLHREGAIHGILAAGGSANTTIACTAMRVLPVGFPKLVVSTLASGDISPYVGTKDITFMYSVVDIAGVNRISARVLANAAHAVAGMALGEPPPLAGKNPLITASMFGVTTPCITEAKRVLEEFGFEVLVFHATGAGGQAMEGLIRDGFIQGCLDITTTELADELVGGIFSAGPGRLTVAGQIGIPQIVSIGAVDMVNFGPDHTVPERFRQRKLYQHNPTVTLMRTTPDENEEIGRRIADRLNPSRGPVKVFLPLRGVSLYAKAGGPFEDAEADRRCREAIKKHLRKGIEVHELDMDINDPRFASECARALIGLLC